MSPAFIARLQACLGCTLLAALGVGLAARGGMLDAGYWIDEAISVGIASHPLGDIPAVLRQDGSPPLYYLLLHQWIAIVGTDEAATRSLSVVFAVMAVPVAWWGGDAVAGRRAGFVAASGAAHCPLLIYGAQETRMYSLVVVLSLLASAAFVLAFVQGRRVHLLTLGVSLVLLLYTHTWAVFLVAGMIVAWTVLWGAGRVEGRDGGLLIAAVGLLYAPWIPTLVYQALHTGAPWSERPSPLFLLVILAALPAIAYLKREQDVPVRMLVIIGSVGLTVAWLSSQAEPAWSTRYLAVLSGPLLLTTGCALGVGRRWLAVPMVVALGFWLLFGSHTAKSNTRAVAGSAAVDVRPGDLVISTQPEQVPVLARYLPAGVVYLTPLGIPADPRLTDWRDALPQLRAGLAGRVLLPQLRALTPGRRVLLVTPARRNGRSSAPWNRSVHARSREWKAAIRADKHLRPLGGTSNPKPGRYRSAVRGELYEVVP
jgi:mannosyltransferase